MDKDDNKATIGMLLDIANLYGENSTRLAPWLYVLLIGASPVLIYVYTSAFLYIPIWLFSIVEVLFVIYLVMVFPGRQKYRTEVFKRQLYAEYLNTAKLMNIKTIHPDGCIEYVSGKIMYLVACYNGTTDSMVNRSIQLRKLLEGMLSDYDYDIYIHNITESESLRKYYNKVNAFSRNTSARNFISMIDHNIQLTSDSSLVQCTIYAIKASRSDWKVLRTQIDGAVKSKAARCYKMMYRVKDAEEISDIFNRDTDTIVDISTLLRQKYANHNYATSKVLAYDLPEDKIILQGKSDENPIIPEQTKNTFHIKYEGD